MEKLFCSLIILVSAFSLIGQTTITIGGSETMQKMLVGMAKEYKKTHPKIDVVVSGGHSDKGLRSLLEGTIQLCAISKAPSANIISEIKEKYGTNGIKKAVAMECVGVFVHKQTNVTKLTSDQLADIYSGKVINWKEVGGADLKIALGRLPNESGTAQLFKNRIMAGIDYDDHITVKQNSKDMADWVDKTTGAVGFGKIVDKNLNTVVLSLQDYNQKEYVEPSLKNLTNNTYPLSRQLFLFSIKEPEGEVKEFLDWLTNPQTQKLMPNYGFYPVIDGVF